VVSGKQYSPSGQVGDIITVSWEMVPNTGQGRERHEEIGDVEIARKSKDIQEVDKAKRVNGSRGEKS